MFMCRTGTCFRCGRLVADEVTADGTMFTCLTGDRPEMAPPPCRGIWWVWD